MTDVLIQQTVVAATVISVGLVEASLASAPVLATIISGAPGVTEHGDLSGLGDDDHPHYHTDARADARYAAIAHTHSIAPAFTGPITSTAASAKIFEHTTASDPQSGASLYGRPYKFNILYVGGNRVGQGPATEPNYVDDVWAWGINMGGIGAKAVTSEAYGAWHLESKFYQNTAQASPYLEHFFTFIPANSNVNYRPIAFIATHDGSYSNAGFAAHQITFTMLDATPRLDFDFRAANACSVYNGFAFNYLTNNLPLARQTNGAGTSSVALPYVDDNDNYACSTKFSGAGGGGLEFTTGLGSTNTAPLTVTAPTAAAANLIFSCGTTQAASAALAVASNGTTTVTAASGAVKKADVGRTITGTNVPANTSIASFVNATTFTTSTVLTGVTSITLSARTKREALFGVDASGAFVLRSPAGTTYVDYFNDIIFRDQSAGYAQKMHFFAGNLGIGTTYVTGAKLAVDGPVRFKSYTVASVPSATAAGAGSQIFVSNESGGAVMAFSDGSAWRRVTDRAVVS